MSDHLIVLTAERKQRRDNMCQSDKDGAEKNLEKIMQNYIVLPVDDDTTNGEIIEMLFPNEEKHEIFVNDVVFVFYARMFRLPKCWWDAPYKAESEDKE